MSKKYGSLLALASLSLILAGCSGETQPYHGTPYDGRTAGSGVEYVRGVMAPPAEINTAPQTREETPPPAEEAAPVVAEEVVPAEEPAPAEPAPAKATEGDKVFHDATLK